MTKLASPRDQEIQAVLYAEGESVGKHGLDGIIGKDTKAAMQAYADKHGFGDESLDKIGDKILEKMRDPAFREKALDTLQSMPQTHDTIAASQWALTRAGHNDYGMRDLVTRMMNGENTAVTVKALEQTEHGFPTEQVYKEAGLPQGLINMKMAANEMAYTQFANMAQGVDKKGPSEPSPVRVVSMEM